MADPVQPEDHPEIPWDDYITLLCMPEGTYGISCDISTTDTGANLPIGWNARRGRWRCVAIHSRDCFTHA